MLAAVNEILLAKGLMLKAGSAVDATLTDAPGATKKTGHTRPGDETDAKVVAGDTSG